MLDMSWGEVMVIGAVALIVIGPKDLPRALRTIGQVTGKLRRMAAEFQGQFNEAMREAELDDVKKQIQGVNDSVTSVNGTSFNPIQTIRDELKSAVETPVVTAESPAVQPETQPAEMHMAEIGVTEPVGDASVQAMVEGRAPTPADPVIDLPPPPMDDPSETIAESLRREAEEAQKQAAVAAETPEKSDAKA